MFRNRFQTNPVNLFGGGGGAPRGDAQLHKNSGVPPAPGGGGDPKPGSGGVSPPDNAGPVTCDPPKSERGGTVLSESRSKF